MTQNTLQAIQINIYIRLSNIIITNASKNFISKEFNSNIIAIVIIIEEVSIKAYQLISKVKYYYTIIYYAYKVITKEDIEL